VKQILSEYKGKKVAFNYGGNAVVEGKVLDIIDDVVKLQDSDNLILFVPIEKIHLFWEVKEKGKTLGFVRIPPPKQKAK
jgi:hypothetical protein